VNAPVYDIDGFDNSAAVVREPHDRGRRVICYVTASDQLGYNRFIARLAHDRAMSVGLKNDLGQIPSLLTDFDFADCADMTTSGRIGTPPGGISMPALTSAYVYVQLSRDSGRERPNIRAMRGTQ
jgi:hypothetical protein